MKTLRICALLIISVVVVNAQDDSEVIKMLERQNESLRHRLDVVEKMIDDQLWDTKVGDLAYVDKV